MEDHGYNPLGKYSSARDDLLHYMCTNGWANDSDGNVEAPTGYFWEISNTAEDVSVNNGEFNSLIKEWLEDNPEVTDSGILRAELVGNFIVTENDQGFISVYRCSDELELNVRMLSLAQDFFEWETN